MPLRTVLYQHHIEAGARMVDFSGWAMPINYGSQLGEHRQVREHAGVFDVSHMTIVDVSGVDATAFLRILLSNDVGRLASGRALYTGMLNDDGGVLDDLIVYRREQGYRLVLNCATREKDLAWLARVAAGFAVIVEERPKLAILAVHGPEALARVCALLPAEQAAGVAALDNFGCLECGDWMMARTGYTGEQGLELMLPEEVAPALWERLLAAGVQPVGLGARDTLRLEAGMNLYGHDMDEQVSPLSANMGFTISWEPAERDFIGRAALLRHRNLQQEGKLPKQVGLLLESRGVLREGLRVITDQGDGVITSGSFSPTLNTSIALARVPGSSTSARVELRGALVDVRLVKPCFVRFGRSLVS